MLLIIVVPVVAVVLGDVIVSSLIASINTLASNYTFTECFKECVSSGALLFLLSVAAIIVTVLYVDSYKIARK